MASKQRYLTDEQALSSLTDAVQSIKHALDGLPNVGAYANVKVAGQQAVNNLKNAMAMVVAKI